MTVMIKQLTDLPAVSMYLKRIGAECRSLKTAVVREVSGSYWKDLAVIRFQRNGEVVCPDQYAPTDMESAQIMGDFAGALFPELVKLKVLTNLPAEIEKADQEDVFEFRDTDGAVVMIQLRREKAGEKSYIPYTYWSDNEWRISEPEGNLPLWGADQLSQHSTVFIHEGAKAARAMARMVSGKTKQDKEALAAHPWCDEMKAAAHIGWIGGALSPHRTDWSAIMKAGVKRAYIVSDNDSAGVQAVSAISFQLRIPTFHVQFTNEWPASWDMADPWPKKMFETIEGAVQYVGPSFRSCLHPATWATDQVQIGKGRPTTVLRDCFKDMWAYVEEADMFVCIEMPEIVRTEAILNKMMAGFSHSSDTARLMVASYRGRSPRLCYRPDQKGKMVNDGVTSAINLHTPSTIKPVKGDPKLWLEFMEYMIPNARERHEALRWCATLIHRLDVRMEYSMLLVSEAQGVGKTTLASAILAPLVGMQNCSFPSETTIVQSEFNGWMANKRLAVINEIYSGHSWKAYNKLKSLITDKHIEVNQKYQRVYMTENFCHFIASSNSLRALKMENDDRRWFYPAIAEHSWGKENFERLHKWLKSGGLGIIAHWAAGFGDYVMEGERAPMTERKRELIVGSRSEAQHEVAALAEAMMKFDRPIAVPMKDIVGWVRTSVQGTVFDSDLELRKAMKDSGAHFTEERVILFGRTQLVAVNDPTLVKPDGCSKAEWAAKLRGLVVKPTEVLDSAM